MRKKLCHFESDKHLRYFCRLRHGTDQMQTYFIFWNTRGRKQETKQRHVQTFVLKWTYMHDVLNSQAAKVSIQIMNKNHKEFSIVTNIQHNGKRPSGYR